MNNYVLIVTRFLFHYRCAFFAANIQDYLTFSLELVSQRIFSLSFCHVAAFNLSNFGSHEGYSAMFMMEVLRLHLLGQKFRKGFLVSDL